MKNNAAVLWTGGKDCALAFLKGLEANYIITHLVTFAPEKASFKAHNLSLIQEQVKAIGLPHLLLTVKPPVQESYENQIAFLKKEYQINTLITGDIDEIENHDHWIEKCSEKSGMLVYNPLWKKPRTYLLEQLIKNKFHVIFSLVKKPFFTKEWVGKELNKETITDLKKLNIDICGENGEYHSMVLNTPYFKKPITKEFSEVIETDAYYYLDIQPSNPKG
ncbi:diphthine-ammonia ligase [Tenacibaculum sp. 190524A02b]|uniref:Diphthine-ammonia ligase n=1 Tax=Tenacibaculum vairaonense TaxID=3137860 RepID=A0ABM9PKN8_9FLAO